MTIGNDANGSIRLGSLNGIVTVPFQAGQNSILDFLVTSYYHVHGQGFVYPDHANNVVLTSSAAAWSETGGIVQVIPAGVLNLANFDLHWINISAISANAEIQIDIFKGSPGSEIRLYAAKTHRNAVQSMEGSKMIHIPQQLAGERISCRLTDSSAGPITCGVSFDGHYYV